MTWEIIYVSFYKWTEKPNLKDLLDIIINKFKQEPPIQDECYMEFLNLKNKYPLEEKEIVM